MNKTLELYNFIQSNLVNVGLIAQGDLDSTDYNVESLENLLFYHTSWNDLDQAQETLENGEFYSNM